VIVFVFVWLLSAARADVLPPPPPAVPSSSEPILSYTADPKKESVTMHWQDGTGKIYGNLHTLIAGLGEKKRQTVFAMNGGMYMNDLKPLGLYIENGKQIRGLVKKSEGYGNFYIQPNGVFALKKDKTAVILATDDVNKTDGFEFATQSGPMLLHKGQINEHFGKDSPNRQVRNGVGILPDHKILFAFAQTPINFYNFADFFKSQGCTEALYLDGSISQIYLAGKDERYIHGPIGVAIAVTKPLK